MSNVRFSKIRCLSFHSQEILVVITEIITIIEIIETVIIVIKKNCKDSPSVLKAIESKDGQLKTLKKQAHKTEETTKEKQKKSENQLEKAEGVQDLIGSVLSWLPSLEAQVLRQTPVSADYHVLRTQQSEQAVRISIFSYFKDALLTNNLSRAE